MHGWMKRRLDVSAALTRASAEPSETLLRVAGPGRAGSRREHG